MRDKAPCYLAGAAAATTIVSIAASQILLGAAIVALLWNWRLLRCPPAAIPLAAFLAWMLVSLAASPDPSGGQKQVLKLFVFTMLIVVFSAIRSLCAIRWILDGWLVGGSLSALLALWQLREFVRNNPDLFYYVYSNGARVTGFMGHWMTFSGVTVLAMMMTAALILFAKDRSRVKWWIGAFVLMGLGLLASYQRGQWAGAVVGATWLLWSYKRILVVLVPVAVGLLMIVTPVRERVMGLIRPQAGVLDSTGHRATLRAVGARMIAAHPVVGVGPDQVPLRFREYLPAEIEIDKNWSTAHLHNIYYHYAAERGLPALAALLWFLGRILYDMARARFRDENARWVIEGTIACTIAIMVSGWGEVNLGDSEVLAMYLSVVGCGYVVIRLPQTS
jgi:O-antigen ligase